MPFSDCKPGDIEVIMDIFVEDFLNFPTTRELGEDSARFVREEMERTWGEKHMAVLSEDESQMWILGVSFLLSYSRSLDPPRWCYPMLLHPCSPSMHHFMSVIFRRPYDSFTFLWSLREKPWPSNRRLSSICSSLSLAQIAGNCGICWLCFSARNLTMILLNSLMRRLPSRATWFGGYRQWWRGFSSRFIGFYHHYCPRPHGWFPLNPQACNSIRRCFQGFQAPG